MAITSPDIATDPTVTKELNGPGGSLTLDNARVRNMNDRD